MGYQPGHAVTPGVEVDFSVDSSKGTDIANWTGVVNFVYTISPKMLAISSLEQKRGEVLTARKQSALISFNMSDNINFVCIVYVLSQPVLLARAFPWLARR